MKHQLVAETVASSSLTSPFDLNDDAAYRLWRDARLAAFPRNISELVVPVGNLAQPNADERAAILDLLVRCNMAIYRAPSNFARDEALLRAGLVSFLASFGLVSVENQRSAEQDGFVVIEVSQSPTKRGFVPYTTRPLNWHTDGYYNPATAPIRAMLLHCVQAAIRGGENALLDHEIAYIRLRDENPRWIAALMHPEAMTIPAAIEEDGRERPPSVGPVFMIDPTDGQLVMRYTARGRNILWRDCADTRAAVSFLNAILTEEREPLAFTLRLAPGEGLICNNVLHTRTGFEDGGGPHRRVLRARFTSCVGASPLPGEIPT